MREIEPVTQWIERMRVGDPGALDAIIPILYQELRALAGRQMSREDVGHTLSATALVHEAYFRLSKQRHIAAHDRSQFLRIAGHTMRRILVDWARTRRRMKRGGGQIPVPLAEVEEFLSDGEAEELLAIDEALERLAVINPRGAKVVEHRFFAGLSQDETASLMEVSPKTIQRDWIAARAWLKKEMRADVDFNRNS